MITIIIKNQERRKGVGNTMNQAQFLATDTAMTRTKPHKYTAEIHRKEDTYMALVHNSQALATETTKVTGLNS